MLEIWSEWAWLAAFIPACFALNMSPGPNNLLAFATSATARPSVAILGGLGRLVAFAGMIVIVAAGLGVLLLTSTLAFTIVKFAGAAYLIYVGWSLWRSSASAAAPNAGEIALPQQFRREFLMAAGNPKAIAIFTAFFPQFLDPAASLAPQFAVLGALFLLLEMVAITLYALAGRLMRGALERPSRLRLLNRGAGAFLIGSGLSLALASRN